MRRTIEAEKNTKEKRRTGTRGGSSGERGKQGHTQAKAQALDDTGGSLKGPRTGKSGGAKKRAADKRTGRPQLDGGTKTTKSTSASQRSQGRGKDGGSTGAARRGTGRKLQKLEQRGETKAHRRATSGKKKTRARSAGRQGAS
jgi:hypothetical protein